MDSDLNPAGSMPQSDSPPPGGPTGPAAAGEDSVVATSPAPGAAEEAALTTQGGPSATPEDPSGLSDEHAVDLADRLHLEKVAHVLDTIRAWASDHGLCR